MQRDDKAASLLNLFQDARVHGAIFNQMSEDGKRKWEQDMSVSSAGLIRGGQSLYNSSDNVIAGGRDIGHNEYVYDPNRENVARFHVKKVRDAGPDRGMFELKFNPTYHRLEEMI